MVAVLEVRVVTVATALVSGLRIRTTRRKMPAMNRRTTTERLVILLATGYVLSGCAASLTAPALKSLVVMIKPCS